MFSRDELHQVSSDSLYLMTVGVLHDIGGVFVKVQVLTVLYLSFSDSANKHD